MRVSNAAGRGGPATLKVHPMTTPNNPPELPCLAPLRTAGGDMAIDAEGNGITSITIAPAELSLVDIGCCSGAVITDTSAKVRGFELHKCDGRVQVVRCKEGGMGKPRYRKQDDGVED